MNRSYDEARPGRERTPACPRCDGQMQADVLEVTADRITKGRPPSKEPLAVLPTWRCPACGCFQPRLAA